jgi:pectin methylesterase-like acyl-CoA thioesterase
MNKLLWTLASVSLACTLASCAESTGGDQGTGGGSGGGTSGAAGTHGGAGTNGGTGFAGTNGAAGGATTGIGGSGTGTGGTSSGGAGTSGGASGAAGSTGRGGTTGTAGTSGVAGTNGAAGTSGKGGTGVAGTNGAGGGGKAGTGAAGTNGVAGTSGTAGTSGAAGSQGNLPAGVSALFPPPGGQNICPDPPLRITFSGAPTLGTSGKIQVFNSSGTSVASVDMSVATVTDTIGGTAYTLLRTAYVDGNAAVIYLPTKALSYGQTYYVTVDSGAIKPPGGGTLSITGSSAWRFTTAAAKPTSLSALTVALDGSGPFCTVQGATDALPANNTAASVITVKTGIYHEIMHVSSKSNLTIQGQDRAGTVIEGTNNNTQQGTAADTVNRSLLGFDSTNGLTITNLTIQNLTPQNGSQAEALRLQRCDKCTVSNANIESLQDTLLWDGRIYADNCYIAGNVDYVWSSGVAYFNSCEIHTVGRSGVIVQARNPASAYGYVFVDSKLTADAAATNNMLARIDEGDFPGSHVAYINCQMTNIAPAGWTLTDPTATQTVRYWEYMSTDASGNPINTSSRQFGTQISASEAAMMRDPTVVLNGWQP